MKNLFNRLWPAALIIFGALGWFLYYTERHTVYGISVGAKGEVGNIQTLAVYKVERESPHFATLTPVDSSQYFRFDVWVNPKYTGLFPVDSALIELPERNREPAVVFFTSSDTLRYDYRGATPLKTP